MPRIVNGQQKKELVFPYIDILRGFAAISVLVYHVIEKFSWTTFPINGPLFWFRIGWMGVDLFFVISGFVIVLSSLKLYENYRDEFRSEFALRRLLRIAPLYYLTLFLYLLFIHPEMFFSIRNLGLHLVFLHNLFPQYHGAINGPNWSVGTEMQFYVLIFILGPFLVRIGGMRLVGVFCLVAWSWRALVFYTFEMKNDFELFVYSSQLPGSLDQFAVGIALAYLIYSDFGQQAITRIRRSRGYQLGIVLLTMALLYLAFSLYFPRAAYWNLPEMVIFYRTLLSLSFGFVVLLFCCVPRKKILDKIFWVPMYLGKISYGIYLWHLMVLESFMKLEWLGPARALPCVLVATIVLAAFSWYFFEHPMLGKKSQFERLLGIKVA
jgi:peptidoglycan/LPS O-acetylase OafA/YrhL